ncbi:MAG: hypothetical protein DELT_02167 [Desulfovibrio sp.]
MKQKIEWYREVLEIEPNSKIFFPLSRMLAKDDRPDEAIVVLRQGVGRHPDHVEARLFLVELLYNAGRAIELQQEVVVLSDLFKNYPGFWRAWGERLFDEDESRDAGLAAIFLAAFLQNMPVSWAGVIEHGLKSLVNAETPRASATVTEAHPLTATAKTPPREELIPEPVARPSQPEPSIAAIPEPMFGESADDCAEDEESEEPITLRTRSMADILAEQGDIPGALDIYNELLAGASSAEEKKALQHRIDVLSGNAADTGAPADSSAQSPGAGVQDAQEEKKDWLAILAQRLEARSLQ